MGVRTKGCLQCKTKKVKCDNRVVDGRPACSRCTKAGIICPGYSVLLRFVDENSRVEHASAVAKAQQNELWALEKSSVRLYHASALGQVRAANSGVDLPLQVSLSGFKNKIITSFLVSKLYEGRLAGEDEVGWVSALAARPYKALCALAALFFGMAHDLPRIKIFALSLYGQALIELHDDISAPKSRSDLGTITSITLLTMYELLAHRPDDGWLHHADALGRLMQMRGPSAYMTSRDRNLFLEQRTIIVSKAITFRQKTFLSLLDWKTIPWQSDLESKQPMDHLVDILCDVASLLGTFNEHATGIKRPNLLLFKAEVLQVLKALNDWWLAWVLRHPNQAYEVSTTSKSSNLADTSGPLFPTVLAYDSLWTAYHVIVYDATRILLLQIWEALLQPEPAVHDMETSSLFNSPNMPPLLGISSDMQGLGREILRSMEYCQGQSRQFLGTYCVILAVEIAYSSFEDGSREVAWLSRIRDMQGTVVGRVRAGMTRMQLLPSCQIGRSTATITMC